MVKYVLTGATGGFGSKVLKHLLKLVPASDIIVSLYNPKGASPHILNSGVEIRRGDFEDPSSLESAFSGADKLFLVSHNTMTRDHRVRLHKIAVDTAFRVGIKHIYYTSLAFAGGDSQAFVMSAHLDTEAYLKETGVKYTILREGFYSESAFFYLGCWEPSEGVDDVVIPYSDGAISWVNKEDLGEATAKIISAESGYENKTVMLTGAQAIDLHTVAEMTNALLPAGRRVTLRIVDKDEYIAKNKHHKEEGLLQTWTTTYTSLSRAELAVVDPLLKTLLGREPTPLAETLKELLIQRGVEISDATT